MEENKYYTPEIDEFHVGFGFEDSYGDEEYAKNLIDQLNIKDVISFFLDEEVDIRVKYIDKQDLIELGFVLVKEHSDELVFQFNNGDYCFYELTLDLDNDNRVCIEQWTQNKIVATILPRDQWRCFNIFYGMIKNKSELIKVLKMLGIK